MSEATSKARAESGTISEDYLADFRRYLRLTSTELDGEIKDLINAARDDLVLGGVLPDRAKNEGDALVKRAISTYVKAEFGLDNDDADKYRAAYQRQKIALALASGYIGGEEV